MSWWDWPGMRCKGKKKNGDKCNRFIQTYEHVHVGGGKELMFPDFCWQHAGQEKPTTKGGE